VADFEFRSKKFGIRLIYQYFVPHVKFPVVWLFKEVQIAVSGLEVGQKPVELVIMKRANEQTAPIF
jgi:hypothetical protein